MPPHDQRKKEGKRMKVIDYMNQHADKLFYLGTASGYVFIGTRDEYVRDAKKLEREEKELRERTMALAARDLGVKNRLYPMSDKTRAMLERRIRDCDAYIDNFVPFGDREIKTVRKSIRGEDSVIIIAEGIETGRFYTRAEYQGIEAEWKPNTSPAVNENYQRLADAVVGDLGREYARAISYPTTDDSEKKARDCERWMHGQSFGRYAKIDADSVIETIRREVARTETRGMRLTRPQVDYVVACFREHMKPVDMADRVKLRFGINLTWYAIEYLVNRSKYARTHVKFKP